MRIDLCGAEWQGYSPHAGGYCFNAIFPDDDLAVIILSNASDKSFRGEPEKMVREVVSLYDKLPIPITEVLPSAAPSPPGGSEITGKSAHN